MKTVVFTDTHVRGTSPVGRTDNYPRAVLEKIAWVINYANTAQADLILHAGDLFDSPNPSEDVAGAVAEILSMARMRVVVVPGNHDLVGHQIRSLPHTKLGLLARAGVLQVLSREDPPYILGDVSIIGQHYYAGIDMGNPQDFHHGGPGRKILVYHGQLMDRPPGFDMPHTLIENVRTDADLVIAGHYHPGWAPQRVGRTWFHNPGSLARNAATADAFERMPQILVIHDDLSVEYVQVEVARPGREVLTVQHLTQNQNQRQVIADFKQSLQAATITINEDQLLQVVSKDVDPVVVAKARTALASIQNGQEDTPSRIFHRLRLENVQSHRNSEFEFVRGINVLLGPSNSGKTAVFRALRWVTQDQPRGTGLIRNGESRCTVTLQTYEGTEIIRSRTRSSTGTLTINGVEYKGFARNLPPELRQAHGIIPVEVQGITLFPTFARQDDPPFLLSLSPVQRALAIAPLGGATRIESAVKAMAQEETRINLRIRETESRLEQIEKELESAHEIEGRRERVMRAMELLRQAENLRQKQQRLGDLLGRTNNTQSRIRDLRRKLSHVPSIDELDRLRRQIEFGCKQMEVVRAIHDRLHQIQKETDVLIRRRAQDPFPIHERLNRRYQDLQRLCELIDQCSALNRKIQKQKERLNQTDELIADLEKKKAELIAGGAVCPTCRRPLTDDC